MPPTFTPPKGDHARIFYVVIALNNVIVQISRAAGLHIILRRGASKKIMARNLPPFLIPLNGPKAAVLSPSR
jgi:hypothetical protein